MDTRSELKTFPMDRKKEMCNDQFELLQSQFSFACCCFADVSFITLELDMNAEMVGTFFRRAIRITQS